VRSNSILVAFACITFLAGIGAAVELFGGSDVQYSDGTGGASGGPYVYQSSSPTSSVLELGVKAHAWAADGGKGNGTAAFTGSGSVTNFKNLTGVDSAGRGFIQEVNYTGRVQATISKTSTEGTADADAEIYARTEAEKSTANDEQVEGKAGISNSIELSGKGTATSVASGTAGYNAQYINKSDKNGRTTSVKTSGIASGDAYMTATNQKYIGAGNTTSGYAEFDTWSMAENNSGSMSSSDMDVSVHTQNGAKKSVSTISGSVNATKSESYAWDTNRTRAPDSKNYNVYTNASGKLSAGAKAYEDGDIVNAYAGVDTFAKHGTTTFKAESSMYTSVDAKRYNNNSTYRVEGTAFINDANLWAINEGYLGSKFLASESNIKTLNGGDNVGAGIFLSNRTSRWGFNATNDYSQKAVWDDVNKRFIMMTNFKMDNYGLNYTANTADTGAIGVRMNILGTGKKLNALYGSGTTWTEFYTDIPQQNSWNWYGANMGTLNQGGHFDTETFKPSGQEVVNSTIYVQRHFTRELDTSNPS